MNPETIGQTYRQLGSQGANPLKIVVMLYDVLLDDLRRAIEALHACDIEKRTGEIQHALRVLEQLQGSLDMERGGEPANNLEHLYSAVRAKLLEAHWKSSEELLCRQIDLLRPVREAWEEARIQQLNLEPRRTDQFAPAMPPPEMYGAGSEWRA